jgi:Zn/Cd-binding protein ZinT
MADKKRPIRCVVYTRKSSEEALEQEFNSLNTKKGGWQSLYPLAEAHGLDAATQQHGNSCIPTTPLRAWLKTR